MKVLFVCRGKGEGISPIVKAQAESLRGLVDLSIFPFEGKGWSSYISNIFKLRKHIRRNKFDVIHAHYSFMGFSASFASRTPIVCSLMGSDIEDSRMGRIFIRFFNRFFWKSVIVKSSSLKEKIKISNAHIIPNGVNLDLFRPSDHKQARQILGFETDKKYALFFADPARPEKNYSLAKDTCELISQAYDLELRVIKKMPHDEIPLHLSAADLLLLTSHYEGSPNIIKEAMACNCPIVSTDVGGVRQVIGDTAGCYISSWDPVDLAKKISLAIRYNKRTNGRENIRQLDDKIIAAKLTELYQSI